MLHLGAYDCDPERRLNRADNLRVREWADNLVHDAYELIQAPLEPIYRPLNHALPSMQGVRIPMSKIPIFCDEPFCDHQFPRDKGLWTDQNRPHPTAFGEGLAKYICKKCWWYRKQHGVPRPKKAVDRYNLTGTTSWLTGGEHCHYCSCEVTRNGTYRYELPDENAFFLCKDCDYNLKHYGVLPILDEHIDGLDFVCDECHESLSQPAHARVNTWFIKDAQLLCMACFVVSQQRDGVNKFPRSWTTSTLSTRKRSVTFQPRVFLKGNGQEHSHKPTCLLLHEYLVAHGHFVLRTWAELYEAFGCPPPSKEDLDATEKRLEKVRSRGTNGAGVKKGTGPKRAKAS